MIDRSYLPFKSAKEYVDRGMAKWMGFFISEHSTSLSKEDETIDHSEQMKEEEISLLISQAYVNKLNIFLYTKKRKKAFLGNIYELSKGKIYFRAEDRMMIFSSEDIIKLELLEDGYEK